VADREAEQIDHFGRRAARRGGHRESGRWLPRLASYIRTRIRRRADPASLFVGIKRSRSTAAVLSTTASRLAPSHRTVKTSTVMKLSCMSMSLDRSSRCKNLDQLPDD
jgi:hypothetical protein